MFSKLSDGLRNLFSKITKAGIVDEKFINESIKELQKVLISGDVNVKLVLELSRRIKDRMKNEKIPRGLSPKQHFINIVYEELVKLVGSENTVEIKPQKILLVGLYGHGKTTTAAKLAKYFSKRGLKTALVTTDTWRPAAYEQLKQMGDKIHIPVYGNPSLGDAVEILKEALKEFGGYDVIIVDSAGRDSLNDELIQEVTDLKNVLKPDNIWLVMGADIGQSAEKQARTFHEALGITGVILTRFDSSAKGGGALAACNVAKVPVVFIGTGEKIDDIELFDPTKFISRLLGFPDLEALLEKVKEVVEDEDTDLNPEEILKGKFTLRTFYKQLEATKKMGSLKKIADMLGFGVNIPQDVLEESEERMKVYKVIMDSMTNEELDNPDVISKSRIQRITKGSGRTEQEVRDLIKQYNMAKKMMKRMKGGKKRMNLPGFGKINLGGM